MWFVEMENEGKSQHTCHKMETTVRKGQKKTLQRLLKPPLQTAGALLQLQILQKNLILLRVSVKCVDVTGVLSRKMCLKEQMI